MPGSNESMRAELMKPLSIHLILQTLGSPPLPFGVESEAQPLISRVNLIGMTPTNGITDGGSCIALRLGRPLGCIHPEYCGIAAEA